MTSRERVLSAIAHKQPDIVPIDLSGTASSGISAIAYSNLLNHLGRDLPVLIYDIVQQLAQPDISLLDEFGVDVLEIGRTLNTDPAYWSPTDHINTHNAYYPSWFKPQRQPDGSYNCYDIDGERMLARMPQGATFFDQTYFPYADGYPADYSNLGDAMSRVVWSKYARSPWDYKGDDFWTKLREGALHLRATTDKALILACGCNLFEWGTFLRRMDNFLMDTVCEVENVERLLDALLEMHLETLEKVCKSVGDVVDIIVFGDDLGMTSGPFMDAETYRKLFKPRLRQMCEYVHKNSSMHTYLHSCGSISLLMPDIIDAGIEIFNPVQTNAKNMSPEFLKREFGADCTFWGGGVESVGTLNNGTPQQVREQVLERLEIMSKGGGYVFNTVHNIMPDVPPENIVAMYDAVKEFNSRSSFSK